MRKIAVFTGTRAEYGLLYWIIKGLNEAASVDLHLYVGGSHLSPNFGHTVQQIEEDGFLINERLDFLDTSDSPTGIANSMGLALVTASRAFEQNKPDLLVVLGDRFELMAICQAAMLSRVPIAHIHGGETTEGLIDEAVRHSVTKMSHLHFTATETYKERVIQLGESPEKVFNVGAPGLDNITSLELLDRKQLSNELNFELTDPYFVVTYHPVTLTIDGSIKALQNLLAVLSMYSQFKFIITYPNADTNNRTLLDVLQKFSEKFNEQVVLVQSLGQIRYLSAVKHCQLVIGNSSSGLIEVPSFKKPTVNIGNRQGGRISSDTVINCDESVASIEGAISRALSKDFLDKCLIAENPYGDGGSSKRILDIIQTVPLQDLIFKKFYDIRKWPSE